MKSALYIVLFLHQTTTCYWRWCWIACCISYYSYIKPQLTGQYQLCQYVVYRTIPTSNHNCNNPILVNTRLYIVLLLHQTTTALLIFRLRLVLYIVLFLHQTTTFFGKYSNSLSCISYYSYIKPQRQAELQRSWQVVYRTIPTSNHNSKPLRISWFFVVYRTIPTSNHNSSGHSQVSSELYIVLFLHQTTTSSLCGNILSSCISYYSYIKPQLINLVIMQKISCISYYSYIKPQLLSLSGSLVLVVYRTIPTSNHDYRLLWSSFPQVVYRTIPTSNHNL